MANVKSKSKIFILAAVLICVLIPCVVLFAGCCGGDNVESIKLATEFKTEYTLGEQLDVSGGTLELTYENGETDNIDIEASFVTEFSTTTSGVKTMKITYEGVAIDVEYTVANFRFGSYTATTTRIEDVASGEVEDSPYAGDPSTTAPVITFNNDLTGNVTVSPVGGSQAGNEIVSPFTYTYNAEGQVVINHTATSEQGSGYYEDGNFIMIISSNTTYITSTIFEPVA